MKESSREGSDEPGRVVAPVEEDRVPGLTHVHHDEGAFDGWIIMAGGKLG